MSNVRTALSEIVEREDENGIASRKRTSSTMLEPRGRVSGSRMRKRETPNAALRYNASSVWISIAIAIGSLELGSHLRRVVMKHSFSTIEGYSTLKIGPDPLPALVSCSVCQPQTSSLVTDEGISKIGIPNGNILEAVCVGGVDSLCSCILILLSDNPDKLVIYFCY